MHATPVYKRIEIFIGMIKSRLRIKNGWGFDSITDDRRADIEKKTGMYFMVAGHDLRTVDSNDSDRLIGGVSADGNIFVDRLKRYCSRPPGPGAVLLEFFYEGFLVC